MKQKLFTHRSSAWILILGAVSLILEASMAGASSIDPIKLSKKQIRVIKTECFVTSTESKRLARIIPVDPNTFGRALWARVSEDFNLFNVLNIFGIAQGVDVIGYGTDGSGRAAPSGPGWRSQYLDSGNLEGNQRHHFGFYYFTGAMAGGPEAALAALLDGGAFINDLKDFVEGNEGDLLLANAAQNMGLLTRAQMKTDIVSPQVKDVLCAVP